MTQIGTQKLWTRPNGHTYQTHCKSGHEFTEETTYISPKSQKRSCRICTSARVQERKINEPELRVKQKLHMRKWRAINPERHKRNWVENRKQKKAWLDAQKLGCVICGESRTPCLDFHHIDPTTKSANVSVAVSHWSIERLQTEIAKCDAGLR